MEFKELNGLRVKLIPLELDHCKELFECSRDKEVWEHLPVKIKTFEQMQDFLQTALNNKVNGQEFPYSIYDLQKDKLIGMTRYLRISEFHRNLNIGWTWHSKEAWGSLINTECKYMLLKQAFENWNACRVELITTVSHHRSQRAIEKLGATREGILRKKYNGKDYVIFSIIEDEWKDVKSRLKSKLEEEG